jgi:hypothetical protein
VTNSRTHRTQGKPRARERIAAERAARKRAEARRRLLLAIGAVTAVVAIVATLLAGGPLRFSEIAIRAGLPTGRARGVVKRLQLARRIETLTNKLSAASPRAATPPAADEGAQPAEEQPVEEVEGDVEEERKERPHDEDRHRQDEDADWPHR